MRVVWSPLALERAVEIAEAIRWDKPGAARKWIEQLVTTVETLAGSPRRGRVVPELDRKEVRELLFGNYRVVYRIGTEDLVILTVRHGRRILDVDEFR
jgi:toxin ParE1/3/4